MPLTMAVGITCGYQDARLQGNCVIARTADRADIVPIVVTECLHRIPSR